MNYLSYSLWGNNPIYNIGMIENAKQAKIIYPNWKVIVYYDNSVPNETITKLKELNVECIDSSNEIVTGSFWRFYTSDIYDCEYAVFRDADSRLSNREYLAVCEYINSKKTLHIMRDHPYHRIPAGNNTIGILAGMWGIKGGMVPMKEMINKFEKSKDNKYGNDQTFLKIIYSSFQDDKLTHDEFFDKNPFPIARVNNEFIGERIDQYNNRIGNDYQLLS